MSTKLEPPTADEADLPPASSEMTAPKMTGAGEGRVIPAYFRKRRTLQWPITLSAGLMTANIVLMVCWIVLLSRLGFWSALTIGTVVFALILVGLTAYLVLTVKEVRVNQRQANFVDSVTHELKSPIASLKLYLETLEMRELDAERRAEFYRVMGTELSRLDSLISHLLEVGRLDAIGQQDAPEDVDLESVLRRCSETAVKHHKQGEEDTDVVSFDLDPAIINGRQLVLEMIFGNLLDNAIKYAGDPPAVEVQVRVLDRGLVVVRISDNGEGVPTDQQKKIFRIFHRAENELERRRTGTGLGLYIARTLVHMLKGKIAVHSRVGKPGSVFEVDLPGRAGG
jgi:two-component system phosphate regulon sensor histidine kinase PhoR